MNMNFDASVKDRVDYFNTEKLKNGLKGRAIRSGGVTVASRVVVFFVQTITTIILARVLSPEEFGLVAMVTAMGGFLVIFIDLSLTDAVIQTSEINHRQVSTLFWINLTASLLIVLTIISLSPLVAWFYSEKRLMVITILWASQLFIGALSTQHIALLKRKMLFAKISINEIIAAIISGLLAIYLAVTGWSYWALVFRLISFRASKAVGGWILCEWRPGLPSFRSNINAMLLFGRNATGSFILGYFARNLDKILVGWRFGADQLGYYNRAYYLFVLPTTQLTEALKHVATSTLSKLRSEPKNYHAYYIKAISVMSFVGMPISFFFMIESRSLILALFGPQWEQSVEVFRILAVGTGVWIIYSTKYWLHASLGRSDRLIRWGVIDTSVTAAAIIVGLLFSSKGVALAYTCALYLLTGFGIKYAGKPIDLKLRDVFFAIWRCFASAAFAGIFCWYLLDTLQMSLAHPIRLIISFGVYSIIYLILIGIFHGSIQPIADVFSLLKQMFQKPKDDG